MIEFQFFLTVGVTRSGLEPLQGDYEGRVFA